MDANSNETPGAALIDRLRKSWFPPAAVIGAFGAFVAAAFRVRPEPKPPARPERPSSGLLPVLQPGAVSGLTLGREYACSLRVGAADSPHPFRSSLAGVAAGPGDRIYALGDSEIRVFEFDGGFARGWKVPEHTACLAVAPGGGIYTAAANRVDILDPQGRRTGGFVVGEAASPAVITAIRVFRDEILVADARARLICRYDAAGRRLGEIGSQNKTGSFMLPNRSLDFDVDATGTVVAGDTGRHKVTLWSRDGTLLSSFGKFGMTSPDDFVGCCNPVDIAFSPDGKIVTAEKMVARVKVYEPGGKLIALIGPDNFDPACTSIRLAVDSKNRIIAADTARRDIKIFTRVK